MTRDGSMSKAKKSCPNCQRGLSTRKRAAIGFQPNFTSYGWKHKQVPTPQVIRNKPAFLSFMAKTFELSELKGRIRATNDHILRQSTAANGTTEFGAAALQGQSSSPRCSMSRPLLSCGRSWETLIGGSGGARGSERELCLVALLRACLRPSAQAPNRAHREQREPSVGKRLSRTWCARRSIRRSVKVRPPTSGRCRLEHLHGQSRAGTGDRGGAGSAGSSGDRAACAGAGDAPHRQGQLHRNLAAGFLTRYRWRRLRRSAIGAIWRCRALAESQSVSGEAAAVIGAGWLAVPTIQLPRRGLPAPLPLIWIRKGGNAPATLATQVLSLLRLLLHARACGNFPVMVRMPSP